MSVLRRMRTHQPFAYRGGMTTPKNPSQVAVWLFLAATFAFASSSLFGLEGLWRWNLAALGFLLIIVGGARLSVEMRGHRRTAPPEE